MHTKLTRAVLYARMESRLIIPLSIYVMSPEYRYSGGLKRRSVSDAMIDIIIMGRTRRASLTQRDNKDIEIHHKSSDGGGENDKGSLHKYDVKQEGNGPIDLR